MSGLLNRNIDKIFLVIFCVFLCFPVLRISNAEVSIKENRMLAPFPVLFKETSLNFKFAAEFEKWFDDHFNGRNAFLNIIGCFSSLSAVVQNRAAIYFKKYGVMFNKIQIQPFSYTDKVFQETLLGIKFFNQFCQDNDIKCYIEVVPEKILFEENKFFDQYKKLIEPFFVLQEVIKKEGYFDVIYPWDELYNANIKDYVFFRTDHHWTDWGAYIGYLSLMKKIKKDIPELRILSLNDFKKSISKNVRAEYYRDFTAGYSCIALNLPQSQCNLNINYPYYDFDDPSYHVRFTENTGKNFEYSKAENKQKVMIIGNSFTENFMTFLGPSFKEVRKRRSNSPDENSLRFSRWVKEIQEYRPEILIILLGEGYARSQLRDLYIE